MIAAALLVGLPLLAFRGALRSTARAFVRWYSRQTDGAAYFGRTRAERDAFKRELRERSRGVAAIARGRCAA